MNRILQYLGTPCPCCRAKVYVERCAEVAEAIEALTGEMVEMIVPSADRVAEDGRLGIKAFVCWESDRILLDNAAADVATELRAFADSILNVVAALEGRCA